ncbi:MAG: AtpZ/AtpI family protein [Rhodospirillales bacterium]|nr:AtpZ/AtpI family protein [Rhodospirillales bacterium]
MTYDPEKDALKNLGTRLNDARNQPIDPTRDTGNDESEKGNALGLAFRVGVELISAVAVGTAIGWGLDRWLDTRPWLMLVFFVIGGAAGILNVYRMARGFGYAAGYQTHNSNTQPDDGTREDEGK